MKIQTMFMLEGDERFILRYLDEALNLVGYRSINEPTGDWKNLSEDEQALLTVLKSIRRVRSDQFAITDLDNTVTFIETHAARLMAQAEAGGVFTDGKLDAVFNDGVKASAELARRQLNTFLEYFDEFRGIAREEAA